VLVGCIEDDLRHLRSGCVVEEYEILTAIQRETRGERSQPGIAWRYRQFLPRE
jgi:hypothetical protein